MPGYRLQRINRLLRMELSNDIRAEVKDPRIHSLSITEVEVSPDLSVAKVFVSYFDPGHEDPNAARECLKALEKAAPYLRELLRRKITLKKIPQLLFKLDTSIERGVRVLRLINELEQQRGENQPEQSGQMDESPDENHE